MSGINRRTLLSSAVYSGAAIALLPLNAIGQSTSTPTKPLPPGKNTSDFIIHNDLPLALETRRSAFGASPITSSSSLFVRNNLPMPPRGILEQPDAWEVEIAGTQRTGTLNLAALKAMDVQTLATVLQCSGNGRVFFEHKPSGSPWALGAAGCVLWTGVPVSDVIERFGGLEGKPAYLTTTGGEELPAGVDVSQVAVERSIPIDKGLKDCMLVWEMNGAPLSLVHGGPLRLIVPGYFGVNNVKWVKRIASTTEQSAALIQQSSYRLRPMGEISNPQHPSMWRMPVKSWLNGPGSDNTPLQAGPTVLYGVAFSGERGIRKVEVSGDGGKTWHDAEFYGPDLGKNAWRTFKYFANLKPGFQRFVCRATDAAGDQQPRLADQNERGYGHNGWNDAALEIQVVEDLSTHQAEPLEQADTVSAQSSTEAIRELSAAAQDGKEIFVSGAQPPCGVCHTLADARSTGAIGPNLNTLQPDTAQVRKAVTQGIGAMPAYGGNLSDSEIEALAAYVAESAR